MTKIKEIIRPLVPPSALELKKSLWLRKEKFKSEFPLLSWALKPEKDVTFAAKKALVHRMLLIHESVKCAHTHKEMHTIVQAILNLPRDVDGVIVEAGCFKGGSTCKISIVASMVGRKLFAFDSIHGIPDNTEKHGNDIFGRHSDFPPGSYEGPLAEVSQNLRLFGEPNSCELVPGWFEDTMTHFKQPVAAAFIDVDLASSTRTCLRYLYPLLVPGGVIFSHDGHLPLCVEVFADPKSWADTNPAPVIEGLGSRKLICIRKPSTI